MSLGVGLGAFMQGMGQGMQFGQQIRGAIDDRKMRKVQKEGAAAAGAARESEINNAITTTQTVEGVAPTYSVSGKSFTSAADARKAAEAQVGSAMDFYRTTTVPKLIQGYIDIGRPEQASQLQTWMDTQEATGLTKDWARGARLAMIGDDKGAMRRFGRLYERMEPGSKFVGTEDVTEPVYEDIVGKDGKVTGRRQTGSKPVGVRLKLRNADGEEVSHDFGGTEELFRTAMWTLSPDKFASRALGEVDQATAARAAVAKDERDYRQELGRDRYKATLEDQTNQRQHERTIIREDRQFAQTGQRDATLSGYRIDESLAEIQARAAAQLSEGTVEKPEDVRKSLETVTRRLAESDLSFAKLTPQQQTDRAIDVLRQQRQGARGVISGGAAAPAAAGAVPRLY